MRKKLALKPDSFAVEIIIYKHGIQYTESTKDKYKYTM